MPLVAPLAMTPTSTDASPAVDLAELFERHGRRLYRLARRMSGEPAEAEDLVQETFLRAARAVRPLPMEVGAAEGWLVRTLIRLAHDRFRRRRVRSAAAPRVLDAEPLVPDAAASVLARHDVARALAELPPRRRAVIVLHFLEERDTASIAELLGIAQVTVRWHLHAGKRQLARRLGAEGGTP